MSLVGCFCLSVACGESPAPGDAGDDAGDAPCTGSADCDDAIFCNGEERCDLESAAADARGCAPGPPPCAGACDESGERCGVDCALDGDADGDGYDSIACAGTDCDDTDRNRYAGNVEVCDVADHDEDCDPATFGFRDTDGDTHADARCCNDGEAGRSCGTDCDDDSPGVHPGLSESCDQRDQDCDGAIDEAVLVPLHRDTDGDGFGDATLRMPGCPGTAGWVTNATDCDDADVSVHPGATDRCNGIDDDCAAPTDPATCACTDGATTLCGYSTAAVDRCAPVMGTCRGGAYDCPPGLITGAEIEVCNGVDDNCVGGTDEGASIACYADDDRDGWAPGGAAVTYECVCTGALTDVAPIDTASDCDDASPAVHPRAEERCDGIDTDCSEGGGSAGGEDDDADGHAPFGAPCTGGIPQDDCDDASDLRFPGQTYRAEPFCPRLSTSCRDAAGVFRCARRGQPCDETVPRASWDYDCDGRETPPPPAPPCGACVGACVSGLDYADPTACGAFVDHVECTEAILGCVGGVVCMEGARTQEALPCR